MLCITGFLYGEVVVANYGFAKRTGKTIAILTKPCTALRRLAVLICTVFGGAPCTELCEYRYTAWTAILRTLPAHECQASCGDRDEFSITAQKKIPHQAGLFVSGGQNMEWPLSVFSGTGWVTSQCSTILPLSSRRKMSITASPRSSGVFWLWMWTTTRSPSATTRLMSACDCGFCLRRGRRNQ